VEVEDRCPRWKEDEEAVSKIETASFLFDSPRSFAVLIDAYDDLPPRRKDLNNPHHRPAHTNVERETRNA
jgi:hypothetical protein